MLFTFILRNIHSEFTVKVHSENICKPNFELGPLKHTIIQRVHTEMQAFVILHECFIISEVDKLYTYGIIDQNIMRKVSDRTGFLD